MKQESDRALPIIDLGTTKFCIASHRLSDQGRIAFEYVTGVSRGFDKGMLANPLSAQLAIEDLVARFEDATSKDVDEVLLGVSGQHISAEPINFEFPLEGKTVTSRILKKLEQEALTKDEQDPTSAMVFPLGFEIDERPTSQEPIGLSGNRLRARYLRFAADVYYLKDLIRMCNACGIRVKQFFPEPLSSVVLLQKKFPEFRNGVLLDIGGGSCDGMVLQDGLPKATIQANIGGSLFTQDIAVCLGIMSQEAERLKIHLSESFLLNQVSDTDCLNAMSVHGTTISVSSGKIRDILVAREKELANILARQLKPFRGHLQDGIVLTGGGSQTFCLTALLQHQFKIPVTHVAGHGSMEHVELKCLDGEALEPSRLATPIGMALYDTKHSTDTSRLHSPTRRALNALTRWISEMA